MTDRVNEKQPLCFKILLAAVSAVLLLFLGVDQAALSDDAKVLISDAIILTTLIISAGVAFFGIKGGLPQSRTLLLIIFACGFAMRLAYAVRYGYYEHQHDVEGLNTSGHLSYIYKLATDGMLPDTNDWQYCHPPLHHFLASLVVRASLALGKTYDAAFENIQLLTVLYSTITVFAGNAIIRESKAGSSLEVWLTALLAFHPAFIILSGSINNDMLTVMLMTYAMLYLMRWYRSPSFKSAALCGLFTGLGMMSKFSAAMIAVSAAAAVLIKFFTEKQLKFPKVLLHASAFCGIMLPLGLWYQIRNYYLFGQAIGYVAPIGTGSRLYIGDISIVKRLLLPFSGELHGVYADVWNEFNLWQYLLRNSLFGEYGFGNDMAAAVLIIANFALVIISLAALVVIIKKRSLLISSVPVISVWLLQMISFVIFNIKYPYRCSMDFRYIVPTVICGLSFIAAAQGSIKDRCTAVYSTLKDIFKFLAALFCVASVIIFL